MAKGGNGGGGSTTDIIKGNKRDNVLTGTSGDDTIQGLAGNDTITDVEYFQFADQTESFAEVIINPQANLSAGTLSIDDTFLDPGESLSASWTIASNGELDATAAQATLIIATSPDMGSVIDTGETVNTSAVATGDTVALSANLSGNTLAPGTEMPLDL